MTIPGIHRWLPQGFHDILDRADVVMILGCFGLLGAGMAARRSPAHRPVKHRSGFDAWPHRHA